MTKSLSEKFHAAGHRPIATNEMSNAQGHDTVNVLLRELWARRTTRWRLKGAAVEGAKPNQFNIVNAQSIVRWCRVCTTVRILAVVIVKLNRIAAVLYSGIVCKCWIGLSEHLLILICRAAKTPEREDG